jgi:hypothetical protein
VTTTSPTGMRFQTRTGDGEVVIDRGAFEFA